MICITHSRIRHCGSSMSAISHKNIWTNIWKIRCCAVSLRTPQRLSTGRLTFANSEWPPNDHNPFAPHCSRKEKEHAGKHIHKAAKKGADHESRGELDEKVRII